MAHLSWLLLVSALAVLAAGVLAALAASSDGKARERTPAGSAAEQPGPDEGPTSTSPGTRALAFPRC